MKQGKYRSGSALRTALEERLKQIADKEHIDIQRLRRQVAFDRILSRLLDPDRCDWVLKGGYSMELRFARARATRDLDFTVASRPAGDGGTLLDDLQTHAAIEAEDHFSFRIGEAMADLDAAPYGGARYPVEAIMAGRTFVRFHIDIGVGDVIIDPVEITRPRDWLGFAGIEPPIVRMISGAQQFAEKIHAYTLPRGLAPNSRVRDLVDIMLLIRGADLDPIMVVDAMRRTFARRGTHPLPTNLSQPPVEWQKPFDLMAKECGLVSSIVDAYGEVREFLLKAGFSV